MNLLLSDIKTLSGVGESTARTLARIGIKRILDFLWYKPVGIRDRVYNPSIQDIKNDQFVTLRITIDKHIVPYKSKLPYKIICHNETGIINIIFFHWKKDYFMKLFPLGEERIISGRAEVFNNNIQIAHPDYIITSNEVNKIMKIEPLYPLTQGLTQKKILRIRSEALNVVPDLEEWCDKNYISKMNWSSWSESIKSLHSPKKEMDLLPNSKERARLAFDELLANQIYLKLNRRKNIKEEGKVISGNNLLVNKYIKSLPFDLTEGQKRCVEEVFLDFKSGKKMVRLLQGDVGSGKTVIAAIAMLKIVESGKQAVLMVPTEILAFQHVRNLDKYFKTLGVNIALLTSKISSRDRAQTLDKIKCGEINIIVGTQAVFQEKVKFHNLALCIIDEQHKFGVEQRKELLEKGHNLHVLLMSATPIPRTLTMIHYGDMDVSLLTEKPSSKQPIDSRLIPYDRIEEIRNALSRAINNDEKIYWICPLIEASAKSDLEAAENKYIEFKGIFGDKVGLIHGKMKQVQREAVMQKFIDGDIRILVATTVIEVGVDVPDASIIVIEHADRFGLSQLHQLRGRVGRGQKKSVCIFLYPNNLGDIAKQRLLVIKNSEDGFKIAEEDLRIRGSGDVVGTKQSGFVEFKFIDFSYHSDLLISAKDYSEAIINNDPELKSGAGSRIKNLLSLFGYDNIDYYIA